MRFYSLRPYQLMCKDFFLKLLSTLTIKKAYMTNDKDVVARFVKNQFMQRPPRDKFSSVWTFCFSKKEYLCF